MQPLNHETLKHTYTTHAVPLAAMAGIVPPPRAPRIGDLVAAEVLSVGRHDKIEDRAGLTTHVFPGDRIVGAFGNRYATEQYEGYVPDGPVEECDLLSVGGVCGNVASRYAGFAVPSRLRVLGAVVDRDGGPLNQRAFGLAPRRERGGGEVVVVVGSAMSAGKTTTVGTLTRALRAAGWRVAAAKVTGTAAGKDVRFYASCGANPALDFTAAGYPSTYLLDGDELLTLYRTLLGHLRAANPDYYPVTRGLTRCPGCGILRGMKKKYLINLTDPERQALKDLIAAGTAPARKLAHARILLKADQAPGGPGWVDEAIAEAVEVSQPTIARIRRQYVEQGLEAALNRRPPRRVYERKLDGKQEAHLIALTCGAPPAGHARWSLRLLADRLVELEIAEEVSYQTVRRILKKTS